MKKINNRFEIYVADFDRAKKFYTEVLGYELNDIAVGNERHSQMRYAVFPGDEREGSASGALVKLDVAKPGIGGTFVYFHCEDVKTQLSRVTAAGGKIIRPKQDTGTFGFIALIEDTEGNMIGLRSIR